MISRAIGRYIRVSPRKTRQVIALIKGQRVDLALAKLNEIHKKPAVLLFKVIQSAVSNARNKDRDIEESHIVISKLIAEPGPMMKRYRAMSMGRAGRIRKRTTHITVELERLSGTKG